MRVLRILAALFLTLAPALAEETRDEAIEVYFAQSDGAKELPWKIEGSLGFTMKDGNSDLLNFAARALFEKRWVKDLLRFTLQSVYSEESKVETASEHILVQRWEHYLGEKHRLYQQLWLETDSQESLALRIVLSAGYGYRFVKSEKFEMWGEVGGGWSSDTFYGGEEKNEGILQLQVEWTWQVTKTLLYKQVIAYWPSLSESGEFKFIWDSRFTLPVSDRWSLSLVVQDQYNSDPQPGNEKNDFTIIFTLNFDFTPKEKKA